MEPYNYSPKDAKLLRDHPDATVDELRELGMSQKGSEAYATELQAKANAPRMDASNVEVIDPKPEPVVTESTVTKSPEPTASAPATLKPQLSSAQAVPAQPTTDGQNGVFKQVQVMTPTGPVAVSQSAAKFLLTLPDHSLIAD